MNKKDRMGTIIIDSKLVREYDEISKVLAKIKFVPVRVEHMWAGYHFEYTGVSKCFRLRDRGEVPPRYTLVVTKKDTGHMDVKVEEEKS